MTGSAWIMLAVTWSVILFFTGRFFWMVLSIPPKPDEKDPAGGDVGPPAGSRVLGAERQK